MACPAFEFVFVQVFKLIVESFHVINIVSVINREGLVCQDADALLILASSCFLFSILHVEQHVRSAGSVPIKVVLVLELAEFAGIVDIVTLALSNVAAIEPGVLIGVEIAQVVRLSLLEFDLELDFLVFLAIIE